MRAIVFEIVFGTMERDGHSDELFGRLTGEGAEGGLSRRERNLIRRISYGTIERALELDAVIDFFSKIRVVKMEPVVRTVLRMGAYELLYMDSIPPSATCDELVKLTRQKGCGRFHGFVNGILRNIARAKRETLREELLGRAGTIEGKLSFLYSAPEELVRLLLRCYGRKTAERILASFAEKRPVTLRVQTMNISPEQVRAELEAAGVSVTPAAYSDTAFYIDGCERIENLPGFAEGHFTVQDESSMLPVLVSGIRPGDIVADVCASPGGKALHAWDLLRGEGLVSARDVSKRKLERIRENADRLRADRIETRVWDASVPDEQWRERADVVLADVPCSGIGVIGRKPEIRYRAMKNAEALPELQRRIVQGASHMLRPGGTFVYSTCTINPQENEEMAEWIVNHLPLLPVSLDAYLPEKLQNKMTCRGMLQILPGIQKGDGFFVAKFVKGK